MPHALLIGTSAVPRFPLRPTKNKLPYNSHFRYWMWDTFAELPRFSHHENKLEFDFTSVVVCEGCSGLYVTKKVADERGLADKGTAPCYIGTYQDVSVIKPRIMPQSKFLVMLKVHVLDSESESESPVPDSTPTCYIGGLDLFKFFDVQVGPGTLHAADRQGRLREDTKKAASDQSFLLRVKASESRACTLLS